MPKIDGARLAEQVANAVGSWTFIKAQAGAMALWVLVNVLQATGAIHFDPYPFVFLNLAMSAEAAFTGPVLLIAANFAAGRDRAQAARIEQLERVLDEHVNVTARQHSDELRANTELTREIHRLVSAQRDGRGRFTKRAKETAA
jgi:uncharacterized membrane protein